MSDSDIIIGIVASVVAVVLASVVIAYTEQTKSCTKPGTVEDGTRIFLMTIAIIVLIMSVLYWIFTGVRNRARISAAASAAASAVGF